MTTDPFTDAARAEAERRHPAPEIETGAQLGYTQTEIREVVRRTFTNAAEWARTHLAAQEPTDAELDAAHAAFTAHSRTQLSEDREFDETVCVECGYATNWPGGYRTWKRGSRHAARAAILAARAVRRDEEKRDG